VLHSHWKTLRGDLDAELRERGLQEIVSEGDELIGESLDGVDRAVEIVRGVKGFAHSGNGARESADVNQLLEDVLHVATAQLRGRASVEREYVDLPRIFCTPQELKQVFLNLVVNAGQAVGESGTIRLRTSLEGGCVVVQVEDDGVGIPPEALSRIFDPFFTTKPVGEGTGLGLGIAYQIVRRHRGEITVDSTPGQGACFRVRLPLDARTETA
jgi:two-component system NtrC family sensor kinase